MNNQEARRALANLAIDYLENEYGVQGHLGPEARWVVVSESDLKVIREATGKVDSDRKLHLPYGLPGLPLGGVPLVSAPDWTCEPLTVAWLRLAASVRAPIVRVLRQIGGQR